MPASEELTLVFLAWIVVALASTAVVVPLWLLFHAKKRGLLPAQRQLAVPWTGLEVGLALFLYFLIWPSVLFEVLKALGFFSWLYGPDFLSSAEGANTASGKLDNARLILWMSVLACPFWVASVFLLFRLLSGTQIYQLGLSARRTVRNLKIGWLGWLILSPLVFGLHILVLWVYSDLLGGVPQEHPVSRLAQSRPSVIDWILISVSTMVVAPVTEELLFRGVLQAWAARRRWAGHALMAVSLAVALVPPAGQIRRDCSASGLWAALRELGPAGLVLALIPGYFLATRLVRPWLPDPNAARAIYATALLFAVFHTSWPRPIPLFILGLGLGFLAYRTQSLLAPIVLHALFNSVSCVTL